MELRERFARHVDVTRGPDECHLWTGFKFNGYGRLAVGGRNALAHRVAWELERGPVPPFLMVLHRCDNPSCVNVRHLWLGTQTHNMRDRATKDRYPLRKLTDAQVAEIRALAGSMSQKALGLRFGVAQSVIGDVINRVTYRHLPGGVDRLKTPT
jgi:hypothetical protein